MSLQELSDATGIPISTLGNYENIDMSLSNLISVFSVYTKLETVSDMKKYFKEIAILIAQLLMFYVFPLTAGPTDAMGMVFLIIVATFVLAIIMGSVSKKKAKYVYPLLVSVLFIPSVFIYYNDSALIHSIWYLVISSVGLLIGALMQYFFSRK